MMLSGAPARPRAVRAAPHDAPSPPLARGPRGVAFTLAGEAVEALPEGALWVAGARALIVSDLHLEKGSSFALRGRPIPPYDTRVTLARLAALIAAHGPALVVSLGDSFHDLGGPRRMAPADRAALAQLVARVDWVWVEGNHDPDIPACLGGRTRRSLPLGGLTLTHEPTADGPAGEVAGHLHPCAKVAARGRSVRRRCFATDGRRLVMPAFGAFAGGLNVRDAAFSPVFPGGALALLLGEGRVHPAPFARCRPDS